MQPCAPQDLIGEQIAEPRDQRLIREDGLDTTAPPGQKPVEAGAVDFRRVRPLAVQHQGHARVVRQPQSLEFALVAVTELTATGQCEQDAVVGVRRRVGAVAHQHPRHSEVQQHGGPVGPRDQPLPVALGLRERPSFQITTESSRADAVQNTRVPHLDPLDGPPAGA
jgi:hypothetical protein